MVFCPLRPLVSEVIFPTRSHDATRLDLFRALRAGLSHRYTIRDGLSFNGRAKLPQAQDANDSKRREKRNNYI